MQAAIRSAMTGGVAALAAAGLVAATPTAPAPDLRAALHRIDVAPTSLIGTLAEDLSTLVEAVSMGAQFAVTAPLGAPFVAAQLAAIAVEDPALIPSLASLFGNLYLNPGQPFTTSPFSGGYPAAFGQFAVLPIARLFPPPLGPEDPQNPLVNPGVIYGAWAAVARVLGDVVDKLPDPSAGLAALTQARQDDLVVNLLNLAEGEISAPVVAVANAVRYVGNLPNDLVRVVSAAIQDPSQIPGLLSHLVYGVLDPAVFSRSLLSGVLIPFMVPFAQLPDPVGDAVFSAYNGFADAVDGLLGKVLPAPITPPPAAAASAAGVDSTASSATSAAKAAAGLESAVAVTNSARTLTVADPAGPDADKTASQEASGTTSTDAPASETRPESGSGPATPGVEDSGDSAGSPASETKASPVKRGHSAEKRGTGRHSRVARAAG